MKSPKLNEAWVKRVSRLNKPALIEMIIDRNRQHDANQEVIERQTKQNYDLTAGLRDKQDQVDQLRKELAEMAQIREGHINAIRAQDRALGSVDARLEEAVRAKRDALVDALFWKRRTVEVSKVLSLALERMEGDDQ